MIVSTKHGFVFMTMPKVCTITLFHILETEYAGVRQRGGYHPVETPAQYRHLYRWTVCRNPFTRAISAWWATVRDKEWEVYRALMKAAHADDMASFMRWVLTEPAEIWGRYPLTRQAERLRRGGPFNAVVAYERFGEDLAALPFWKTETPVPHLNPSHWCRDTGKTVAEIITPEVRDLVIEWAPDDFSVFGYSLHPVFARNPPGRAAGAARASGFAFRDKSLRRVQ